MDQRPGQAEFEAMLRRYVAKVFARYAPVLVAGLLVAFVIVLVPTTKPISQGGSLASGGFAAPGGSAAPGDAPAGQAGATPGGATGQAGASPQAVGAPGLSGAGQVAGGGATGGGGGAGGATSRAGGVQVAPGGVGGGSTATKPGSGAGGASGGGGGGGGSGPATFLADNPNAGGTSKTGIACTNGARQFSWSGHSPYCQPAFTGNNGGATMQGVTGSTITLTFRIPSSADNQAINAATGTSNVNYPAMEKDFQTYVDFFNTQFELYGRHVVIKFFNGQGDYIQEDEGQNLAGAQADAQTARAQGGWGDVTFDLGTSQAYEQDIAQQGMEDFSSIGEPDSFFAQYAPYEWSVNGPTGTNGSAEVSALICQRMFNLNANFAGNTLYQNQKRKFGLVYPETPNYKSVVDTWEADMAKDCGLQVSKTLSYQINVANFETEATQDIAQLQSDGDTTVLCACDPVYLIFMTASAQSQNYGPEWFSAYDWGDASAQGYTQPQWSHSIAAGYATIPPKSSEAYRAFKLADPTGEPAESGSLQPYFSVPYYTLMHVFEGLQAAGPDLTPAHYAQGMFGLPQSVGTDPQGGQWTFGPNVYDPISSFGVVWWNQSATSPFNGKAGTYQACNGGQVYTLGNLRAIGGPGQQLDCFGK